MELYWEEFLRSAFYSFIFVCGVIGNVFVILFFSFKMKRVASEFRWFVIHLAIADLIYAIFSPIHLIYQLASHGRWQLGIFMCKLVNNIGPMTVNVSAWILCLMGYERYRCVCHPYLARFTTRMIHSSVVGVWVICIGLKVLIVARTTVDSSQQCFPNYTDETEYVVNNGVALFTDSIAPIIVQSYFLIRITYTLRKRSRRWNIDVGNRYSINLSNEIAYQRNNVEMKELQHIEFLNRPGPSRESDQQQKQQQQQLQAEEEEKEKIEEKQQQQQQKEQQQQQVQDKEKQEKFSIKRKLVRYISNTSSFKKRKQLCIKDKQDRKTVAVFSLAVVMFAVATLPFNLFYFIVSCLYSYYYTPEDVAKYERLLYVINDWLALLVLSGCVLNVLIYSGKFPQFKEQIYLWLQRAKKSVSRTSIRVTKV